MIISRVLFLSFLTVVNSFCVFGAAATGDSSGSSSFRISCIQLKAYDATQPICDTPHECRCADADGIQVEVKYSDKHGLGRTFKYVSPDYIPGRLGDQNTPGTHAYFLKQVVDHKNANFTQATKDDERNTLFVRMQCQFLVRADSREQTEQVVNFYLGLFVSGREDYYPQSGVKILQLLPSCPNSTPVQLKNLLSSKLTSMHCESVKQTGYLYSSIFLYSNADSSAIESQKMNELVTAVVASKKNFFIHDEKRTQRRFIMHSGKKLDDYGSFIRRRLFPKSQRIGAVDNTDSIFWNLFGRLRYDHLTAEDKVIAPCLVLKGPDGKDLKDGLGNCFFDSEQSFLSMLENADTPCETDLKKENDAMYELSAINLSFYSFRDMCRFCRGTFSHMMHEKILQEKVLSFLTNRFDKGKFKANDGHYFNVMVFGHEKTDKQ